MVDKGTNIFFEIVTEPKKKKNIKTKKKKNRKKKEEKLVSFKD